MHILFLEPFLTPILFFFIAIVLISGFYTIWLLYKKEKDFEKKREGEFSSYEKILDDAHNKAEHIIGDAAIEATKISHDEDKLVHQVEQQVQDSVQKIVEKNLSELSSSSSEFLTAYQSSLQHLKSSYEKEIDEMIQKIREDTVQEFVALQNDIKQKTIDPNSGFSKRLEDEFNKTQIEIHEYKKNKIQEVNLHMDKLIMQVSEEVLGQIIPVQQHQQLIIQALEKAQKEGVFDT